jgi:preprotein translocase subunit SecD
MSFIRKNKDLLIVIAILILVILAGIVVWPGGPDLNLEKLGINYNKELKFRLGLDLQGGTHLAYDLDLSKIAQKDRSDAIASTKDVIEKRVNAFGVTEPIVQTDSTGSAERIIVELPGLKNTDEAVSLIGQTAQMEFKELSGQIPTTPEEQTVPDNAQWKSTGLTGAQFTKATADFSQNNEPEIKIQFNGEGTKLFSEITQRNIGKPLAIFLDNQLITAPKVNEAITDGNAVISGGFKTIKDAKNIAIQLNAGALPVPLKLSEQQTVGATLGQESVQKSLTSGLIGLILVALFMILYYRLLGLLSAIALVFYTLIVLAIFKLAAITLTLGGIAGFILSVGAAAEASVLIFARMREELTKGKTFSLASEEGFTGAWPSIRDSNIVSLIICIILYWFGTGSVRGFAVTLAIGIIVSIFLVSTFIRSLLRLITKVKLLQKPKLYAVSKIGEGEQV